jgi:hypothetical protein
MAPQDLQKLPAGRKSVRARPARIEIIHIPRMKRQSMRDRDITCVLWLSLPPAFMGFGAAG